MANDIPSDDDFWNENEDFLNKRRKVLNKYRNQISSEKGSESHWMICPKCASKMNEFELVGIMIDQCEGCGGLFFDNGELETLLEITDRRGFFDSVKKTFFN